MAAAVAAGAAALAGATALLAVASATAAPIPGAATLHEEELRYRGDATRMRVFVDRDFRFNIPDVDDVGPGKLLVRFGITTTTRAVLKPAADLDVATNDEQNPGDTLTVSTAQRTKDAAENAEIRVLTAPTIHIAFDYENDDGEAFECEPLPFEGPPPEASDPGDRCGRIDLSLSDIPGIDSDEIDLISRSAALPYGGSLRLEGDPIPTVRIPVCKIVAAFSGLTLLDGLCSVRLDAVTSATVLATGPTANGFRGAGRFARDLLLPTGTVVPGGVPLTDPVWFHWDSTAPASDALDVPCAPGTTLRYTLEQLAYGAFVRDVDVQGEIVAQILGKRLGFDIRLGRFDAFDLFDGAAATISATRADVENIDLGTIGPDNRAPTVAAGGPYRAPEGSALTFETSGTGPAGRFDECHPSGEGMAFVRAFPDGSVLEGATVEKTFVENGSFAATLSARDAAGNESVVPFGVQIDNVAPLAVVTAPAERPVVRVGTPVAFAAEASDPGLEDVLTYAWRFGDGSGETRASLNRSDATTHAYSAACICTATLDVSDDDGGAAPTRAAEVVVFDPAAGKLTGGAKFVADSNSIGMPAGSVHALNATVQYDTGATVPKGTVDFEAAFTGVRVRSTSLKFLVITATEAIIEGDATLNGSAGYGFLLRVALAPDGRATGMTMDVWRPGVTSPAAPDLRASGRLEIGMIKTH